MDMFGVWLCLIVITGVQYFIHEFQFLQEEYDAYSSVEEADDADQSIPDRFYTRLGKVVYIIRKKHNRMCVGHLIQVVSVFVLFVCLFVWSFLPFFLSLLNGNPHV